MAKINTFIKWVEEQRTTKPAVLANTEYSTPQIRNIIISTNDPTNEDGANGDIWIKYTP